MQAQKARLFSACACSFFHQITKGGLGLPAMMALLERKERW